MARKVLAIVGVLVLIVGSAPGVATAWGGGRGGHGGHGHHGGHHGHHGHRGGCCWSGAAFFGGLAFGAALAYPYAYPAYPYTYPYYRYPYAYYPYPYPEYTTQVITTQPQASYQPAVSPQPAVQREVVYPHGKYVLYGDGMTQPWQWVWIPASPPVSAPTPARSHSPAQ